MDHQQRGTFALILVIDLDSADVGTMAGRIAVFRAQGVERQTRRWFGGRRLGAGGADHGEQADKHGGQMHLRHFWLPTLIWTSEITGS